jgi:molybdenum cofactor cytidylyltransferase
VSADTSGTDVAGLILAAGESRRMGFPKALLELRGQTFLDQLVQAFARRCSPVIVVLGAEADRIRAGITSAAQARIVLNPDYRMGMITSLQCGMRAIPPEAPGVLFTLVDHPRVTAATLDLLLAHPGAINVPRCGGRRGHPVYFPRALFPELLALDSSQSARVVLERHSAGIRYCDVEDPGILEDVDDPEAYLRLRANHDAQS